MGSSNKHQHSVLRSLALKTLAVPAFALCYSGNLFAQEAEVSKHFQIDLLIYTLLDSQTVEDFSQPPTETDATNPVTLVSFSPFSEQQVQLLPLDGYTLKAEADRLARSRTYSPLLQLSWTTALKENESLTYKLPEQIDEEKNQTLSGSLTIALRRYLHTYPNITISEWTRPEPNMLDTLFGELSPLLANPNSISNTTGSTSPATDLKITQPLSQSETANQAAAPVTQSNPLSAKGLEPSSFYTIKQPRRMRSGELHLFDHPKFGILMKITPIAVTPSEDLMPVDNLSQETLPMPDSNDSTLTEEGAGGMEQNETIPGAN